MSIVLDGSLGVTFPSGSGTQAAQSKVLQVVNVSWNTNFVTSSSSFVDATGATASITPIFSTSKVLIIYSVNGITTATNTATAYYAAFQIVNGSGTLVAPTFDGFVVGGNESYGLSCFSGSYLHSPSTTSSYTYKFQCKADGSAHGVQINNYGTSANTYSCISLLEIAA